jgi:hypothetical protein
MGGPLLTSIDLKNPDAWISSLNPANEARPQETPLFCISEHKKTERETVAARAIISKSPAPNFSASHWMAAARRNVKLYLTERHN